MSDYLIRGTAMNNSVRFFAVQATQIVQELHQRHGTYPTATAALGRMVCAGLMMGAMLKGEERLTIQVKGDGPLGQLVVDANAKGEVRGYVDEPQVHLPSNAQGKLDVAGAVGSGYIHIIKDLGLKEPYRGSIPIISGELAEDLTYYFATSEQTPSAVALGVLVDTDNSVMAAGGFIIQILPEIEDDVITALEQRLAGLPPITTLIGRGDTLEVIMKQVLSDIHIREESEVVFRCQCSEDRVGRTLISLGKAELTQMIEEDRQAEVICHFCNEVYHFDQSALLAIRDGAMRQ